MISIYKTVEDELMSVDKIEDGCWVYVTRPTTEELERLQDRDRNRYGRSAGTAG